MSSLSADVIDAQGAQTQPNGPAENPGAEDSAVTKAELRERNGDREVEEDSERPSKRTKVENPPGASPVRQKGVAPIKPEFLLHVDRASRGTNQNEIDDDAAEASGKIDARDRPKKREKKRGQNKARNFGSSQEEKSLCSSRAHRPEFSPDECSFGGSCRFEHDLRAYLRDNKRANLITFGGVCPIWNERGKCPMGWKCRFVDSHSTERDNPDGSKELVLVEDESKFMSGEYESGVVNVVTNQQKISLSKKTTRLDKSEEYSDWLSKQAEMRDETEENRAEFIDPPFLPSEKRRIYFGPDTPVLAPLTTQGNIPFRRLCLNFGAQLTYSEMAMSLPLIQGSKSEWALMKAHTSETTPPSFDGKNFAVEGYNNSRDSRFGAQIAGNAIWAALKATEAITKLCPHLRVIDLNCGCPIDLVYRQGAGSGLLDHPSKLAKILKGMNAVSESIPISVKIRMGTKDNKPSAINLVNRLVYGERAQTTDVDDPCGVAAITLHGRSRQQRYTKSANWEYISSCAALIKSHREKGDGLADTVREADDRYGPASRQVYFIGNGDCFSHVDYNEHIANANVDSVMFARGALIKPWIFEEIEKGQYIDKSASERLAMIEKFAKFGLDTWGSDELGVGTTRRFLLDFLSFSHRYVPIGLLEYLPPNMQDRPPAWKGRNDLETQLASDDYKDWIKIR